MSRTLDRLAGLTDTGLDELDQDPQDPEQGIDEAARERTRRRYRQVQDPLERLGTLTDPAHKLPASAEKPLDRLARLTAIPTAPPVRVPAPEELLAQADDTQALPTPPRAAAPPLPPALTPTPESTVPATAEETAPTFDRFGEQVGTRPVRKPGEPPAIRATAPPGPLERVAEAVGERVREKYRAKSAAPGAPSALPLAERRAQRQAGQAQVYGGTPEELQQDLLDFSADESGVAHQVGAMLGDFVDPAVLAGGAGGEMVAMAGLKAAAARGVPLAGRLLALTVLPEGAGLLRRLLVRVAHGVATGGAVNVGAQAALTAEEQGRLPTAGEALGAAAAGTALGPAFEAAGGAGAELLGGKAAHPPVPAGAPGPELPAPRVERRAKPRGGPTDLSLGEKVSDALLGTDIKGLKAKASIDKKTGALTADAGQAVNEAAIGQERQPGERFLRYRLDMDNFKALNDARGHAVGDQALEATVAALREATRGEDLVALTREGGDEFSISLQVAKDTKPLELRDRLEQAVDARLKAEGLDVAGDRQVSASIGHAEHIEGESLADLDARADAAAQARKAERAVSQPRGSAAAVPEPAPELLDRVPGLREKLADAEAIGQTAGPDAAALATRGIRRAIDAARQEGTISPELADHVWDAVQARVAGTAPPPPRPEFQPGPAGGTANVIKPADGASLPATYRVVEASDLVTSHEPETFAVRPEYPPGVQERRYHADPGAQAGVVRTAQQLDPDIVLDRTTRPTEGPPITTPDGVVLSGNQRSMAITRAYRTGGARAAAYKAALGERAAEFGLDPATVAGMREPVLVRTLAPHESVDLSSQADLAELASRFNDVPTKALDPLADAATRARRFGEAPHALEHFAATFQADESLRDYLGSAAGRQFVQELVTGGVLRPAEVARFRAADGGLTPEGTLTLERMFYAAAVGDPEVVAHAPADVLRKLEPAVPAIVQAGVSGWEVSPILREALELQAARRAHRLQSVQALLAQGALFETGHMSEEGVRLAQALDVLPRAQLRERFETFARAAQEAERARSSGDLFGYEAPTAAGRFRELFPLPERARQPGGVAAYEPRKPRRSAFVQLELADKGGLAPATPLAPGWRGLDDITARRVGIPGDLQEGLNLLGEESAWQRAVRTPGSAVTLDDGTPGVVVQGAKDPVNGVGKDGMALVKHQFEGRPAERWYPATQITPRETGTSTVQQDFFGKPKLLEPEQRTLLSETAGQRAPALKSTKISPEEIARVRREGAEPAGERPGVLPFNETPRVIDTATADDGTEYTLSYRGPTIDPTTGKQLAKGGYAVTFGERGGAEGGRQGLPTEAAAREVMQGFVARRARRELVAERRPRPAAKYEGPGGEDAGVRQRPGDPRLSPAARATLVKDLAASLQIPIRTGKIRGPALGLYKISPEAIRVKTANDIETVAHEVGHHLQVLLFGEEGKTKKGLSSAVWQPWKDELAPLAVGVSDESLSEGFAEFVRRYLTNPEAAQRKAPRLYAELEGRLRGQHPDVFALLERTRAGYQVWLDATPRARLRAQVSINENPAHASARDWWTRKRADWVDDMTVIERAVKDLTGGQPEKILEDATALARLTRGADGLAAEFIDGKARAFKTLAPVGKSLREVFAPVKARVDDFRDYAVALRAQELQGRGIETGIAPADVAHVLEELESPLFRQTFNDLQTWNRQLLTYLRDAGVMEPDALEAILESNKAYLPFYRVMEDAPEGGITYRSSRFGYLNSPVKRIKGSGREIIDPFESLVKNAQLYTHIAQRQQVSNALAALAETQGAGKWIERVPTPQKKVATLTAAELAGIFGQQGRGPEFERFLLSLGFDRGPEGWTPRGGTAADAMVLVFRPGDYMKEPNMISVLKRGKRVWYEVAPDLYQALMGLRQEHMEGWVRMLSAPARVLRAGATLAPEFIGRNPFRDQVQAFITSDYGFKPGLDFVRGLFHMLKGTETYGQWRAAGGERSALLGLDRKGLRATFARDVARKGVSNVVYNPLEMLRAVSEAMENATRIGEFARAVGTEGTGKEGLLRAATAAREVTVDFARHGAKTQGLRNIAAFWNARLQGYDRLFRAVKAHPVRTLARTFAGITLPSVALYYVNRDDPEYWELPQWQRDLFWCVKISGHWVRIPKPFELGVVFGSIPERILEWWDTKDPRRVSDTVKNFLGTEIEQTLLPMPTFLQPLWDNYGNYSSFRRRSLIPRGLQDVAPEAQVTPGTSEVAAHLGRFLNYPPAKIDNLLNAWTGGLGRVGLDIAGQAIAAADHGQRERFGVPPSTPQLVGPVREGTPFVRGFVARAPGASSESVERFYNELATTAVAWNTAKLYERTEDDAALDAWLTKHETEVDRYEELRPVADDIAGTRAEINQVRRDPLLSADEKARQIRELERDIMQTAEEAVGFVTGARGRRGTEATRILGRAGDVLAGAGARRVQPRE